jgi:hypothetical protein
VKIFDVKCPHCGTHCAIAESDTLSGESNVLKCTVCGDTLASFHDEKLRVARVLLPAGHALFHIPAKAPQPLRLSLHSGRKAVILPGQSAGMQSIRQDLDLLRQKATECEHMACLAHDPHARDLHQLRANIYREIVAEAQARLEPPTGQPATGSEAMAVSPTSGVAKLADNSRDMPSS